MSKSKLYTGEHKDSYTYIKPQKAYETNIVKRNILLEQKLHNNKVTVHLVPFFFFFFVFQVELQAEFQLLKHATD